MARTRAERCGEESAPFYQETTIKFGGAFSIMIECSHCHHTDVRVVAVTLCESGRRHRPYAGYTLCPDGFVLDDLLRLDLHDYSTEDEEAMCYNCYVTGSLDVFGFGTED